MRKFIVILLALCLFAFEKDPGKFCYHADGGGRCGITYHNFETGGLVSDTVTLPWSHSGQLGMNQCFRFYLKVGLIDPVVELDLDDLTIPAAWSADTTYQIIDIYVCRNSQKPI